MKAKWHEHPGVRSGGELKPGERAADLLRNGMGSWCFVGAFSAFMAIWMSMNGHHGFDPFPYILLNLILSTLAGLQGAIILIAARRADQVSAELSTHDHILLTRICERLGICDHPECQEDNQTGA